MNTAATPIPLRQRIAAAWPRSMGARMVLLFLGLLFIVQATSFWATRASLESHARGSLPDKLQLGERVLQSLLEQRAAKLIDGARLLTADYGFRAALQSNDAETLASVLANHGARIGAAEVALLGLDFNLRAFSGPPTSASRDMTAAAARLAMTVAASPAGMQAASEVALIDSQPHQLVMVPVRAPVVAGWVLMSFPLDQRLVQEMMSLSSSNLSVLTRSGDAPGWRVAMSSLPPELGKGLAAQLAAPAAQPRPGLAEASGGSGNPPPLRDLLVAGQHLGVHTRWLSRANAPAPGAVNLLAPVAPSAEVLAVVSLSVDEAVRMPQDLQVALLLITLLGFAVFALGSMLTARRVTTPLRLLSAAAERLGQGDMATPMRGLKRQDEVGQLAQAFEHMRVSVGDKQAQILQLAYWDALTGLPNRAQFRDAVQAAIDEARRHGQQVAVLMLDLDRFKQVNEVLGFRFGDLLLKQVAERLKQQIVRGGDLVARLGGDEFAVLLEHGDGPLAAAVAERLMQAFDTPLQLSDHTVDMHAGIGIACWPLHADDADLLLSRAEVAMYTAKRRASAPLMFEPAMDASSAQTLGLLSDLRRAIDQNELRLFLQPKLSLDSGAVVGAEALVRWQHPTRGMVPPMQFIPFAEQTGFIRAVTLWVFEEAARQWQLLHADGLTLTLSVNLSTRDLLDPDLPRKFDALLFKHRAPAESFCLEITESAIMDDPKQAMATLDRLSALGFLLSIDDFGTGYSSLAYLKRLPVDELKIDQSFVKNMESDADDAKIVRSTIDLAHNMGLCVVAEGVETAKAWDMLRELNCDTAQGFHMGKPMPVEEFKTWCGAWAARQRPAGVVSSLMLH
jgi:diguanylate cyclase (GGDEF)-like protein